MQAAAFASLWRDAIVQADAMLAGDSILVVDGDSARIQMNQNLDRAWVRGARLEVSGRLWPKTTFRSVINWTLGSSLDDAATPLSHIPPTFGVVEVARKGAMTRWSTSVRYAFAKAAADFGPGSTDNLQEALPEGSPGWATWNVEGAMQVTDRLEVQLSGLNLLDLHYRTLGRAFRRQAVTCAPRSPHDSEYLEACCTRRLLATRRWAPNCESPFAPAVWHVPQCSRVKKARVPWLGPGTRPVFDL